MAFSAAGLFLGGKVVHDDDITLDEGRRELGLDIGVEDAAVHRPVDAERRGQTVAAQAGDESLGFPVSERSLGAQALAFWTAAAQTRHLRGGSCLIDEDEPVSVEPHPRLAPGSPFLARLPDVRPILFAGQQGFF